MSDQLVGFVAASISVLGFGSNFVVVKKFETGDGMFFQFVMCVGIWIVGVVVQMIRGYSAKFEPYAMLGGMFWALGNVCVTPIIKCIGMALGLLIWGAANMLTGWCMGYFGLFGVKKDAAPKYPILNIVGVGVALLGMMIYFFIEPEDTSKASSGGMKKSRSQIFQQNQSDTPFVARKQRQINDITDDLERYKVEEDYLEHETSWVDHLTRKQRQVLGFSLSLLSGFFYGINFSPPTHLEQEGGKHSTEGLDYVFSHFSGILLTSIALFVIYAMYRQNDPQVNNKVIVPAIVSGIIWAIAQSSWFIANQKLGLITAYPIISTGPGVIASLWGLFVFGEIQGRKNLIILCAAIMVSFLAVALITLSKVL